MFRKVKAGDPIDRSASTHNATIDAAAYVRQQVGGPSGRRVGSSANADCILVQNISGDIQQRYTALALKEPAILPADNQDEFNRRVVMTADVPTADDEGRWCVLLDTLDAGADGDEENGGIGVAVVVGVTICQINLTDVAHEFVEVADGSVNPASGESGLGQILWVKGGVTTADATGIQPAIIRIGGASAKLPVGEYVFMSLQTVAQDTNGFDFERLHPMIL
jgi:hypothetical protein